MKILHLCLQSPYTDYWGYQDNLLPQYHKKMGMDVTVLTTNTEFSNGEIVKTDEKEYILSDGEKIIRKAYKKNLINFLFPFVKIYKISDILERENPDLIFVHGLGNLSVLQVVRFLKKHKNCKVVADNHVDYYNESPELKKSKLKRKIIVCIFKILNGYMQRYYIKVYGVTPWRVSYQEDVYGIRKEKSDLLVLGADDEKIRFSQRDTIRKEIRKKHNIPSEAFLIITGGKINMEKNIHLLVDAVRNINDVYLLVFGVVDEETKSRINGNYDSSRIKMIGWIKSEDVYDYFLSADLVAFPGTHSVLWEQACACGIPGIFKYWEGMNHVDVGGNCVFLNDVNSTEIEKIIVQIVSEPNMYYKMKNIAENKAREVFLYSNIAKKIIKDVFVNKEEIINDTV